MRILVVDDAPEFLEVAGSALRMAGHDLVCCELASQGIAEHARFKPDIVILDLVMPRMDGFETLKVLRKRDPSVKILAICGIPSYLPAAKYLGADAVMSKPFSPAELIEKVQQLASGDIRHGDVTLFWRRKAQEALAGTA